MGRQSQPGKFITIEGTEGVGKTTNIEFIKQWLNEKISNLLPLASRVVLLWRNNFEGCCYNPVMKP